MGQARADGYKRPPKQSRERNVQLPDLLDALGAMSAPVPAVSLPSGSSLGRIEDRIEQGLRAKDRPDSDVDLLAAPDTGWDTAFDEIVEGLRQAGDDSVVIPGPAVTRSRFSRRVRSIAACATASVLLTAGVVSAARDAGPGSALFPVKIRVESIQLAMSVTQAAKIERLNAVYADRLGSLRDIGPRSTHLPSVTGQLDSAGIASVRLIEGLKGSSERTRLAAALNGLARSSAGVISDFIPDATYRNGSSLYKSLTAASMIISATERILHPEGAEAAAAGDRLVAGSLDALPPAELTPVSGSAPGSAAVNTAPPTTSRNAEHPKGPGETGTGSQSPEGPGETDPKCDAAAGSVCLRLPTLPVEKPL